MNRRNSTFIKHPSQSIPGKYYYYNIGTGESVWNLSDLEMIRRENTRNIGNEPKPMSQAEEHSSPLQYYGSVYPKLEMPNVMWAPVPIAPHPFLAMQPRPFAQTRMCDRYTQTFDIHTQFSSTDKELKSKDSQSFVTSTPQYPVDGLRKRSFSRPVFGETFVKKTLNFEGSNVTKVTNFTHIVPQTGQKLPENSNAIQSEKEADLNGLLEDDLRFKIIAKRRKLITNKCKPTIEIDKDVIKPKKKVMFNIKDGSNSDYQESRSFEQMNKTSFETMFTRKMKNLANSTINWNRWYIVIDTGVLLDHLELVESIVLADETCYLLIPQSVMHDIEYLCNTGDYGRIDQAKKCLRYTSKHWHHIDHEINTSTVHKTGMAGILNCCQKLKNQKYHAVLITCNNILSNKAKLNNIHSVNIQEIINDMEIYSQNIQNEDNNSYTENDIFDRHKRTIDKYVANTKNDVRVVKNVISPIIFDKDIVNSNDTKKYKTTGDYDKNLRETKTLTDENTLLIEKKNKLSQDKKHEYNNRKLTDYFQRNTEMFNWKKQNQFAQETIEDKWKGKEKDIVKDITQTVLNKGTKVDNANVNGNVNLEKDLKGDQYGNDNLDMLREWMCHFTQIIEDALTDIIHNNVYPVPNMSPPWYLQDAIKCIKEVYIEHSALVNVVNRFLSLLGICCCATGQLKAAVKQDDFMKLFRCGFLLIEALKQILPKSLKLIDTEESLKELQRIMKNPVAADIFEMSTPKSPILEISGHNYINPPRKGMKYYSPDFIIYKPDYTDGQGVTDDPKVFRVTGRNLNTLKIDSNNSIGVNNVHNLKKIEQNPVKRAFDTNDDNKKIKADIKDEIEIVKNVIPTKLTLKRKDAVDKKRNTDIYNHNKDIFKETKTHMVRQITNKYILKDDEQTSHENTFGDTEGGPKIIRNIKIMPSFESIINQKTYKTNDNCLNIVDNDVTDDTIQHGAAQAFSKDDSLNNDHLYKNEGEDGRNDVDDDTNDDSGFENENVEAYSLVKTFFAEISGSYKMIYEFIDTTAYEIETNQIDEEKKKIANNKANAAHKYMSLIIKKLHSIVHRELKDRDTMKSLLAKGGVQISEDRRLALYRQVVSKCLEQAQMLEKSLRIILSVTVEDYKGQSSITDSESSMRFLNIFE